MCPDKDLLSTFVDEEVPSPWKEQIQAHVDTCPDCQKTIQDYAFISDSLQTDVPDLSQEFLDASFSRLVEKIQTKRVSSVSNYTFRKHINRSFSIRTVAAIAAFFFLLPASFFLGKSFGQANATYQTLMGNVALSPSASSNFLQAGFLPANPLALNQPVGFPPRLQSNTRRNLQGINVLSPRISKTHGLDAFVSIDSAQKDFYENAGLSDGNTIVIQLPNISVKNADLQTMLANILMNHDFSK